MWNDFNEREKKTLCVSKAPHHQNSCPLNHIRIETSLSFALHRKKHSFVCFIWPLHKFSTLTFLRIFFDRLNANYRKSCGFLNFYQWIARSELGKNRSFKLKKTLAAHRQTNKQTNETKKKKLNSHWLIRKLHDKHTLNGHSYESKSHLIGGNNFDARARPFAV